VTNRELLVRVLRHPAFLAGRTDTAFFDRHGLDALAAPLATLATTQLSAAAAALASDCAVSETRTVLRGVASGWRNVASQPQHVAFTGVDVRYCRTRDGLQLDGHPDVTVVAVTADEVILEVAGVRQTFAVARYGSDVFVDSPLGPVRLRTLPRFPDPSDEPAAGSLLAPMPGSVVRLAVAAGDAVRAGQPVLWLEAMKMQHRIDAPRDGVIVELPVRVGAQVEVGTVLAVLTQGD
jgi:propionyl-CoA carboxylase alpha chain